MSGVTERSVAYIPLVDRTHMLRSHPSLRHALGVGLAAALLIPASLAAAVPAAAVTLDEPPGVMVALGDSITRGSAADGTSGDNLPNSWTTGTATAVVSHRTRIAKMFGTAPTVYNVAQGGTETSDLPRQATLAVSRSADYVTILSGGNNVCRAQTLDDVPSLASVRSDLATALEIINRGAPNADIVVASVPSLMSMYLAGRGSAEARYVWSAASVCPIMLAEPWDQSTAAQARRASVEERVDAMNTVMAEACRAAARCTSDNGAVNKMPITFADLSTRDYFHPSVSGQAKIAAATWAAAVQEGAPAATTTTIVDNTSSKISWAGAWEIAENSADRGGSVSYLYSSKSIYSLQFSGTRVSIEARKTPSSGISEVRIDGELVGRIDGYSPTREYRQLVFVSKTLPAGAHTIKVTSTADKNPDSTGRNSILDALIVESSS